MPEGSFVVYRIGHFAGEGGGGPVQRFAGRKKCRGVAGAGVFGLAAVDVVVGAVVVGAVAVAVAPSPPPPSAVSPFPFADPFLPFLISEIFQ